MHYLFNVAMFIDNRYCCLNSVVFSFLGSTCSRGFQKVQEITKFNKKELTFFSSISFVFFEHVEYLMGFEYYNL